MTLKAVIFDWGGVLVRTTDWRAREEWERRLGLAPGQSSAIVFGAETGYGVQLGRVSDEEHWAWVAERLGLSAGETADFRRDFFACDVLDRDLLAYIDRLRARYHVGLLSNASSIARSLLTERFGVADSFDSITISSEEGVMKPDASLYQIALARARALPQEAVLVDDVLANIEAAQALGMQGVHFTEPGLARARLLSLTGVL